MPILNISHSEPAGQIVSLEGDIQTITTQLRLLSQSSRVLTLPPIAHSLPKESTNTRFNATSYILQVHESFSRRCQQAREFLHSSNGPRGLVLMNGGCVAARTMCIARISKELAGGDTEEGEKLFDQLVSGGVAGLKGAKAHQYMPMRTGSKVHRHEQFPDLSNSFDEEMMVAARRRSGWASPEPQALDDTFLETSTVDALANRLNGQGSCRDSALSRYSEDIIYEPPLGVEDFNKLERAESAAACRMEILNQKRSSSTTMIGTPEMGDDKSEITFVGNALRDLKYKDSKDDEMDDVDYKKGYAPSFNGSDNLRRASLRRSRSLEFRRNALENRVNSLEHVRSHESLHSQANSYIAGKFAEKNDRSERLISPVSSTFIYKTKEFNKSDTGMNIALRSTIISVDQVSNSAYSYRYSSDMECQAGLRYASSVGDLDQETPFEPVFPLIEDVIIIFSNGQSSNVLHSVVRSYKNGSYPPLPRFYSDISTIAGSESRTRNNSLRNTRYSFMTVESKDQGFYHHNSNQTHFRDASMSSAYTGNTRNQWPERHASRIGQAVVLNRRLTETRPTLYSNVDKFAEITSLDFRTDIGMQDAFRLLLSKRFPDSGLESSDFLFTERFLSPVLRLDDKLNGGRMAVDQILAVGFEEGVDRDLFYTITGQIERLGTKKSGLSKTSHVDLRYLVSNVIQSLSLHPVVDKERANPLAHPTMLAELLVPQIESFLAFNDSTRLLTIRYDPSLFQIVTELRRLFGADIFKIATIVDSADDAASIATSSREHGIRSRRAQKLDHFFGESVRPLSPSHRPSTASPKSPITPLPPNTDFALPSSATEDEISIFISCIRSDLVAKNRFFAPERGDSLMLPPLSPSSGRSLAVPGSAELSLRRPSTSSGRSRDEDKWEGFFEDSDDEEGVYRKRDEGEVMVALEHNGVQRKGNSRKALKWLGLS